MSNIFCAPKQVISSLSNADRSYYAHRLSFFEKTDLQGDEHIALGLKKELIKQGYNVPVDLWDFFLICFSVAAADFKCKRNKSEDGWTRQINLTVAINNPSKWTNQVDDMNKVFRILTGDFWNIKLVADGESPPLGKKIECDRDCISLLSGGLDSLIGAIDLHESGKKPIFVSQRSPGDTFKQADFANVLEGGDWHQSWPKIFKGTPESSTRGRSIVFFAYALLATCLLDDRSEKKIYVPENGFISINPPLSPGRVASFSTKTTYPPFIYGLQKILNDVGINITFILPYAFKTKGEMMLECKNQDLLEKYASTTTSCGRFVRRQQHCGRCLPCMVRRASFLSWNKTDQTSYLNPDLKVPAKSTVDDAMGVACAVLDYRVHGLQRFIKGVTYFATPQEKQAYDAVVERGMQELGVLLSKHGVL